MTSLLLLLIVIAETCIDIKEFKDPEFRKNIGQMAYTLGSPIVYLFCAAFLFKGANWARIFFYAVCLPLLLLDPRFFLSAVFFLRLIIFGFCAWRLAAWPAVFYYTGKDIRKERPHHPAPPEVEPSRARRGLRDY